MDGQDDGEDGEDHGEEGEDGEEVEVRAPPSVRLWSVQGLSLLLITLLL